MKRQDLPTKPEYKRRTTAHPIPVQLPKSRGERATVLDPETQARVFKLVEKVLERDSHRSTN